MFLPRLPWDRAASDRGQVLERDWAGIRDLTFRAIRVAEAEGAIPSLIYSPMIVDDGRRLLISNLDLMGYQRLVDRDLDGDGMPDHMFDTDGDGTLERITEDRRMARVRDEWPIPVARHDDLDNDNDGNSRNAISISALELFKLVPGSDALSLATAARMSATFPFVSPAVNLPTDPPAASSMPAITTITACTWPTPGYSRTGSGSAGTPRASWSCRSATR